MGMIENERILSMDKEAGKKGKKIVILCGVLGIILATILFYKCYSDSKSVDKFINYIEAGEYKKAEKCYNTKISGSKERKEELRVFFADLAEKIYDDYNNNEGSYKESCEKIEIYSLYLNQECESLHDKLDELYVSKESYEAAESFFNNNDYSNALAMYKKVLESDVNYERARDNYDLCYSAIVGVSMAEAEEDAQCEYWIEAICHLNEIKEYVNKNDIDSYNEKYGSYIKEYCAELLEYINEYCDDERTLTYNGYTFKYKWALDMEITDIVDNSDGTIVYAKVSLADGVTKADVQYMITYRYDNVWRMLDEVIPEKVLSWELPVYAVEERQTIQEWDEAPRIEIVSRKFYNKNDNTLATFIDYEEEEIHYYEYVDGKLYREYVEEFGPSSIIYYNEEGQITYCQSNYDEYYTYDDEGRLTSYIKYYKDIIRDSLEYVYEDGLIVYEREYYNYQYVAGDTESSYQYIFDSNGYIVQKIENAKYSDGYSGTINYYYENDENGNPLAISRRSSEGKLYEYSTYTYHENGEIESRGIYNSGTVKPAYMFYYDEIGNMIRESIYEYAGLSGAYVYEETVYYEYDEYNRQIEKSHFLTSGYYNSGERCENIKSEYVALTEEEILAGMAEWPEF